MGFKSKKWYIICVSLMSFMCDGMDQSPSLVATALEASPSLFNTNFRTGWLGPSRSIEEFNQISRQATQKFLETYLQYKEAIPKSDLETLSNKHLPEFEASCRLYLQAWEKGDPTAEAGVEKAMDCIRFINTLKFESSKRASGGFEVSTSWLEFIKESNRLKKRDKDYFCSTETALVQKMLSIPQDAQIDDPSRAKRSFKLGHIYFLRALQNYSEFTQERDKKWLAFISYAMESGENFIAALQSGNLKSLKRIIDLLKHTQPQIWGFDAVPKDQKLRLEGLIGQVYTTLNISNLELNVSLIDQRYQELQQQVEQSKQKTTSEPMLSIGTATAVAAAAGSSLDQQIIPPAPPSARKLSTPRAHYSSHLKEKNKNKKEKKDKK